MPIADLPIEVRVSILGHLTTHAFHGALLSGHIFYDAFRASPRVILERVTSNTLSPEIRRDAVAYLIASRLYKGSAVSEAYRIQETARLTTASESAHLAQRLEEEPGLHASLVRQLITEDPDSMWAAEDLGPKLLEFWCFACGRETPSLDVSELQALASLHTAAERVMADFVTRATSDPLPESLHTPPRLLSPEEAGEVMAQLSATERTRIYRAFYRGQLLNCFFMPPTDSDNLLKAAYLCATWRPWEVQEILTLHAYFRHQHELILEQVNSDFLAQLHAGAPEHDPPDEYRKIRSSLLDPPFETCICVDSRCVSDRQVNLYIEHQTCLGFEQLLRFLRHDRLGQRRLVRELYHASSPPLIFDSEGSYFLAAIETREKSLFAYMDHLYNMLRFRHGSLLLEPTSSALLDQPAPGWSCCDMEKRQSTAYHWDNYAHSLLTGLVFWDGDRLDDIHRRVRESVEPWALQYFGFPAYYALLDAPSPDSSRSGYSNWWFTVPPKPLPSVDEATVEKLRAEFGCMCDASVEHGAGLNNEHAP